MTQASAGAQSQRLSGRSVRDAAHRRSCGPRPGPGDLRVEITGVPGSVSDEAVARFFCAFLTRETPGSRWRVGDS
jgi:hypothetical protein